MIGNNFTKRISLFFHSMKMKNRLIALFVILFLVSLLGTASIYSHTYQNDISQQTIALFEQTVTSYDVLLNNLIKNVSAIASSPLYSSQMQTELSNGSHLSNDSRSRIYQSLSALSDIGSYKFVVLVYNTLNQLVFSNSTSDSAHIVKENQAQWFDIAENKNGTTFLSKLDDTDCKFSFVIIKQIKSTSNLTPIGLAVIAVPTDALVNISSTIIPNANVRIILTNADNNLIYDCGKESGKSVPAQVQDYLDTSKEHHSKTINTSDFLGCYIEQKSHHYNVLIYVSKHELMQNLKQTQHYSQILLCLITLMVILMTVLLANSITRPLQKITALMKDVQNGDLTVRFHARYSDEVGILGTNFNQMLDHIHALLHQVAEAETIRKQVEIDALKGQINPHFIFNTLETFRMMAVENDNFELADDISTFGKIVRYNITLMNEITTIQEEINYLQHYIQIQNCRFNNRISLYVHIEPPLEKHPIIKLLIQPIAENAIIHGLPHNIDTLFRIQIHIQRVEEALTIKIHDNGDGMKPEQLTRLHQELKLSYLDAKSKKSIGLRNVNERISLYYGPDYGLSISSQFHKGTSIKITIPYQMDKN